jgi:hypothetical protein
VPGRVQVTVNRDIDVLEREFSAGRISEEAAAEVAGTHSVPASCI